MIIWGTGGDTIRCGTIGEQLCHNCDRERPFDLVVAYRYFGFYWVFNVVTSKRYFAACRVCQHGAQLDSAKVEQEVLNGNPIPFMRRCGLATLGGVLALMVLFVMVAGSG